MQRAKHPRIRATRDGACPRYKARKTLIFAFAARAAALETRTRLWCWRQCGEGTMQNLNPSSCHSCQEDFRCISTTLPIIFSILISGYEYATLLEAHTSLDIFPSPRSRESLLAVSSRRSRSECSPLYAWFVPFYSNCMMVQGICRHASIAQIHFRSTLTHAQAVHDTVTNTSPASLCLTPQQICSHTRRLAVMGI